MPLTTLTLTRPLHRNPLPPLLHIITFIPPRRILMSLVSLLRLRMCLDLPVALRGLPL